MTSLLAQLADDQFAACQIVAAIAHSAPDTQLPVTALAQVLFLDEADMHTLYGDQMTASEVVAYVRNCPASHLLTFIYGAGVKVDG
ncbi:hypothetical protein [Streptomyces mangrovisoli]|uniref:Uncharacterized protein n=1 Tax=Streptomyces mangrovisoli TaxID=1428628 RepID=A0A1J4P649_9ACTN|nr:hypothetical protein [Streptomyces mangrovisoli]OIJ69706.1 hypothetical protein WN71_002205 [Streptomyces mangrovisoli]